MASYGALPGVKITTESGTVGGVTIGRSQYTLLVGVGDNAAGSASTNEPVAIESRSDVDAKFGKDTDISTAYRRALTNGANPNFVKAIMADTTETTESFAATASGTLSNAPIVAQTDRITVTDTSNSTDVTVNFVYDSTVPSPSSSDTVNINPHSGAFEADASSDYDVTYDYADWTTAIEALPNAIVEREFAVAHLLENDSSLVSTLQSVTSSMRDNLKMVVPFINADPNTTSTDNKPRFDTSTFTSSYDDETLFSVAPTATEGASDSDPLFGFGAGPAVAGLAAGAPTTDPIFDDAVQGVSLDQQLSRSEVRDLSDQYVIPIRDIGTPRVERNHSTYDQTANGGWERDYFRRRIVDLVVATVDAVADAALGNILRPGVIEDVDEQIRLELAELVDDGLLETGGQEVDVYEKDSTTIGIDLAITPFGVAKSADATLTVQV